MLVRLRRVELDRDVRSWIAVAVGEDRIEVLQLDSETAAEAGMLNDKLAGDPVDRVLYATASDPRQPSASALRPKATLW